MYACGTEVIVPAKTFSKISAEHTLRFSGHLRRCSAIWAASHGPCSHGADPVVTYLYSSYLFWIEVSRVISSNRIGDKVSGINAYFAPQYLGGYDYPIYIGMTTNEVPDSLTKYTHVITSFCREAFRKKEAVYDLTALTCGMAKC